MTPFSEETTNVTSTLTSLTMNVTTLGGNSTTPNVIPATYTTNDAASPLNVTTNDDIISSEGRTITLTPSVSSEASDFVTSFNVSDILSTLTNTIMTTTDLSSNNTNITTTSAVTRTSEEVETIEQRVAKSIDFWVPPFLFFIGIVANVLVILVMQSKYFRHMSTSFYMGVSSVVDMASLLVSLPAHYLYVNFPQVFDNVRDAHAMCSFFNLFGWGSSDMGVLLTVAMTTERSLAIQFPLKAPTMCTVKRAKIVTVCLFVLEILKVGHLVVTSRVAPKEVTSYLCVVDRDSDENYRIFYDHYWPYVHNVFLVVAFIVIIIGNIIITVHVKRSEGSKDIGEGAKNVGGGQGARASSKSRQLSLMLIIDSATIVICTLPFSIYVVLAQSFKLFDDTPQGRGESNLAFAVVFYLLYVNRCANFFLYCVSGARFRQALRDILSRKSTQKNNYVTGATNTRNVQSSTFTTDAGGAGTAGNKVCMNPMGPSTSKAVGTNGVANNISTSFAGPATIPGPAINGRSKLERHYGYAKTPNGK